jgi:hypothetical protein
MSNPTLKYRRYINYIYDISGSIDISGSAKFTTIRDISNNIGSNGQVLSSTGSALSWIAPSSLTVGTATNATTLANTRTLWGQNFNGSADVSGNLTSVGNITGTGAITIAAGGTNQNIVLTPTGTGNVGIGTNAPETELDVSGNSIQCSNQGRFKGWYTSGGSGLATEIGISLNEGYINAYNRTAGTYSPLNLVAGPSANIRLQTNGNVGIGTATPNYKLHVEGSGTADEIVGWFNNQGAFSSSIAVRQANKTAYLTNHQGTGTPNYDGQLSNAISFGVSSSTSPIQFWNGNTGVGARGTAKMTILENGNFGIGTNAPAYNLDVSGSAKFTTIRDSANLTGTSGQVLSSTGSALSWIAPSSLTVGTATNSIITNDVTDVECFIPFVNSTPSGTAQHLKGNSSLTYSAALGQLGVPRIKPVTIRDATESAGSAGQVLSSTGSALSWISPSSSTLGYAIIRQTNSSGSGSGTFFTISPTPVRLARPLNSLVAADNNLGVTLASSTVTIPTAGTYVFRARASFCWSQLSGTLQYARVSSKLMIALTSGTPDPNWIVGESYAGGFNPTALSQFSPAFWLECNGVKTVPANTTIQLTQICRGLDITTLNVLGGSSTLVDSIPELYATVEIQRIA